METTPDGRQINSLYKNSNKKKYGCERFALAARIYMYPFRILLFSHLPEDWTITIVVQIIGALFVYSYRKELLFYCISESIIHFYGTGMIGYIQFEIRSPACFTLSHRGSFLYRPPVLGINAHA